MTDFGQGHEGFSAELERLRRRVVELEAQGTGDELRRHTLGLTTLLEVSGRLASTLELEPILQATTDGVVRLFGFDTAAVYLLEGETLRLGATTPALPPGFPEALRLAPLRDHPHIRRALATLAPVHVPDLREAEVTAAERAVTEQRGLRTVLFVPLVAGVKAVGTLIVGSVGGTRPVSGEGLDLCRTLANLSALATENARLFRAGRQYAEELERQIAERRRSEAERMELERRLLHAQKLESLGVLAGGIAHDFNNLLQAILGNLDLALEGLPGDAPARESVESSKVAAHRATDLTRQLLAYSGKGRFIVKALDLSALVRENAHFLRASVPRTVALELQLEPGLPPIEADAGQIQQVVMNLITNAADAIGAAPGTIALATSVRPFDEAQLRRSRTPDVPRAGRFVALEVRDTGCGMEASTLERLFDPFFSTKGAGRGLGMSALLGIVRGHGGALIVESAPGAGTTVHALFPAMEGARAGEEIAPAEEEKGVRPPLTGAVLVVDDEEVVRGVCRAMVRSLGFEVLTAADGREAVELFRANVGRVGAVLLDVSMPRMDGMATLDELRRIDPAVRVVLSSGFDEQESTRRLSGGGLVGFIQKPYSLAALREALRQA
jgi:signal transduction histidine kinase